MRRVLPLLVLAAFLGPGAAPRAAAQSRPSAALRGRPDAARPRQGDASRERREPAKPRAGGPSDTSRVHLGLPGAGSDAFVAWPPGQAEAPGVIVLHEWWGLDAHVRQIAARLASQGYVAIVPDLYHGQLADDPVRARALKGGLDEEDALGLAQEAARWLRAEPRSAHGRIGVVGFCMGGALAERFALRSQDLSAVVMYYGTPETDPAKLARLGAPLQGHFGAEDAGIPLKQVEELKAALGQAGRSAEIHVYAGAGHAFMHEGRDTYRPDAARQAWARTLAFLQRYLKDVAH